MRIRSWMPTLVMVIGICLIAGAVTTGEAEVSLFLVFPVISGTGWMFLAGVLMIVVSFILWFVAVGAGWRDSLEEHETRPRADRKPSYGGVILIGPIPVVFGSNRRIALIMLMLGVVLAVVVLALLIGLAN